jgi:hypothetical protein
MSDRSRWPCCAIPPSFPYNFAILCSLHTTLNMHDHTLNMHDHTLNMHEQFEDTTGVTRSRTLKKDVQYNDQ